MTKWYKDTRGVWAGAKGTRSLSSLYSLRKSEEASQRKRYFTWGLTNKQGMGKQEGEKYNKLCNLGNISLMFAGIKIVEKRKSS